MLDETFDVVVVGARVAGASTALHLARHGLSVLLVDRSPSIGPAFSSHQVNMTASECLRAWGLYDELAATDCPAIRQIDYDLAGIEFTTPVPPLNGIEALHYWKRGVLDPMLVRHAAAAGAVVRLGTSFRTIVVHDDASVTVDLGPPAGATSRVRAKVLVGADGRASAVAQAACMARYGAMEERARSCFAYYDGVHSDRLTVSMRNDRSCATFPTSDGQTCAVLAFRSDADPIPSDRERLFAAWTADLPKVQAIVGAAPRSSPFYYYPGASSFFRVAAAGRCALVGDAGYFRDPIVGDGIGDAMLCAELLATLIARGIEEEGVVAMLALYGPIRDEQFAPAFRRVRSLVRFESDVEKLATGLRRHPHPAASAAKLIGQFLKVDRSNRAAILHRLQREGITSIVRTRGAAPDRTGTAQPRLNTITAASSFAGDHSSTLAL